MVKKRTPERGDLVWMNFDPSLGHEQKGKRPALVLSPERYNFLSGRALFCPITSVSKDYPFEVGFIGKNVSGVVLVDQVRIMDWKNRGATFIEKISDDVLDDVCEKLKTLCEE